MRRYTINTFGQSRPYFIPSLLLLLLAAALIVLPLLSGQQAAWRNAEPLSGLLLAVVAGVLARVGRSETVERRAHPADVTGAVGWSAGPQQLRRRLSR